MAYGTSRPAAGAHAREPRTRRWIAAAVWGVCLLSCLLFWAGVGLVVWLAVT
jgi:hypothetical protein